ncbi:hypothetical protein [Arenicella xantha]|uniref:Lipoprotein n=1 Tax=Arenicella xantha TaxID=644221 RepID=A0A395JNP7_9GAMM|nr:hypothetical protein [Arenicella xantha]RBP53229.1 hypothetical protein DFR28_101615 [Arenicella xantha]
MIQISLPRVCGALLLSVLASACTTINVDQVRLRDNVELNQGDAMVVLGRHQTAEVQTESSLIACIGNKLARGTDRVRIIGEPEFVDAFYPWFEARTAPLRPAKLKQVLDQPLVAAKIEAMKIRYFVWVEGSTERTDGAGSMSCSIGPGGGGCFGFSTWEDTSDYETTIWDIASFTEVGRVSTEAVGTSYMPAFVIPIPFLAQVQGDACEGMGSQLVRFFSQTDETELNMRAN